MNRYSYEKIDRDNFRVFKYTTSVDKENSKKFLVISDLHFFSEKDVKLLENLMISIAKEKYDAIIVAGDIIEATNPLRDKGYLRNKLLEFIEFLGTNSPTFIASGAHDLEYYYNVGNRCPWVYDALAFTDEFLNKVTNYHNINVQDGVIHDIGDNYKIGILNPNLYFDWQKNRFYFDKLVEQYNYRFLDDLNDSDINTIVCHYPDIILKLQKFGLLDKVNLGVAGHTHNGIAQLKYIPLEDCFNLMGMKNRGIVPTRRGFYFATTKCSRGVVPLNERANLVINPALKTISASKGNFEKLDGLFYKGMTEINYVSKENLTLVRKK